MFKQRILAQLSVKGDIRFISHHDLMRVLGRAARRAGLLVAMSEGFNPRQKISILLARPVGVASEAEYVEIELTEWMSAGDVMRRLNETLPDGIRVEEAVLGHPHKRHRVAGIDYRITCRSPRAISTQDVRDLLSRQEIWVERKQKRKKSRGTGKPRRINIRPFIRDIVVDEQGIHLSLEVTERGTTRPEEVLALLGMDPDELLAECTVARTNMRLAPSL